MTLLLSKSKNLKICNFWGCKIKKKILLNKEKTHLFAMNFTI